MGKHLKALLVEDSPDDAALLLRELKRAGYDVEWERVETAEAMSAALTHKHWQVILSDYHMPSFSAPEAFRLLREHGLDLPFIIVSGTVGEEVAVGAMRVGVHDYLLKGSLTRLAPAIEREMREASLRAAQKKMQEQLLIADRMASVGTLAAGVAHEINNPLAALIANVEFSLEELERVEEQVRTRISHLSPSPDAGSEWLAKGLAEAKTSLLEGREAANRVRLIVRDLKVFSRAGDEEQRGPVDLKRVLESSLRMARNEIRHRAQLVTDYGDVPPALGNESRLGQVFLNLIINAAQAIPEGRTEQNEIRVVTKLTGSQIMVEIQDTGPGIPADVLPRIFDPFFTTKAPGVGTGLGLAICHRIIDGLGGRIEVDSTVGVGTTFRVLLPLGSGTPEYKTQSRPVAAAPRKGRVVVVDDDPMINNVLRRLLSPDHKVTCFTSVREALDWLHAGNEFDVLLCDLMMPEMTGPDLHAELARTSPELASRIVFMTGGAFTAPARAFLDRVPNARLEKPFDGQEMRTLVQTMIPTPAH